MLWDPESRPTSTRCHSHQVPVRRDPTRPRIFGIGSFSESARHHGNSIQSGEAQTRNRADDDALFLQIKEAGPSVLETYLGKSLCRPGRALRLGSRSLKSAILTANALVSSTIALLDLEVEEEHFRGVAAASAYESTEKSAAKVSVFNEPY